MSNYAKADTKSQWYQDNYPGSTMNLNSKNMVLVLHTTETPSWPGYSGGAMAPNYTGRPPVGSISGAWRAHFPDEKSSRALENRAGGVQTNTQNALQVELIGTCDPKHAKSWSGQGKLLAGRDYVYWAKANDAQLKWLADMIADQNKRHGLSLTAPAKFNAYPSSYGNTGDRLTFAEWNKAVGIVGHQHIPENSHGDPGYIDVAKVIAFAKGQTSASAAVTPPVATPAPVKVPTTTKSSDVLEIALNFAGSNDLGHKTQGARAKVFGEIMSRNAVDVISVQEAALTTGARGALDKYLKPLNYVIAGGDHAKYQWYGPSVKKLAIHILTARKTSWYKAAPKYGSLFIFEKSGIKAATLNLHLEYRSGSVADQERLEQMDSFMDDAEAKLKAAGVKIENLLIVGDTNSEGLVVKFMAARGYRNLAKGTKLENVDTFIGFNTSPSDDKRYDYAFSKGEGTVTNVFGDKSLSDHKGLKITRKITG